MNLPPVDPVRHSRRATAAAVAITLLSLAGFIVFAAIQLPSAARGGADFPNYYLGGERLFSGRPVYELSGRDVQGLVDDVAYDAYPADPPATVALLAPLSLLPYATAWWFFAALSALLVSGVSYLTSREVGWSRLLSITMGAIGLASSGGRYLLVTNHMESILMLVLFLGWRALRRGDEVKGGALWGIAAALKLFPAFLIVGLFAARRTKAGASALVTAAVASGLGGAILGWDNTIAFFRDVLPASQQWYGALGNYSLLSFGTALVSEPVGWVFAAVGTTGLTWWYWRSAKTVDQVFVGGLAAALLIAPLSWVNYLVLVIPGVLVIASRLDLRTVEGRWTLLGLVGALGFWGPIVLADRVPSVLLSFVPMYALAALFFVAMRRLDT